MLSLTHPGLAPTGAVGVGLCARLHAAGRVSPRRATHFLLLRQEKVSKEKASRIRRPCGHTALLSFGGVRANSAAPQTCAPLIRRSLRYSPPHNGEEVETANSRTSTRHGAYLWCSVFGLPCRYEEASSADLGGSGLALFERSEFSQTPLRSSNTAYRRSRATNPARLSLLTFFGEAKKVSAQSGAQPDLPHRPGQSLQTRRNLPSC